MLELQITGLFPLQQQVARLINTRGHVQTNIITFLWKKRAAKEMNVNRPANNKIILNNEHHARMLFAHIEYDGTTFI